MTANARKGSALLIVLGMLAFMVISAVAFSAYMRYSRLPSSYLRRTVSSRMLVKAAIANAIDEIDAAIGNNPHPGVGSAAYSFNSTTHARVNGTSANRNHWLGRVYVGSTGNGTSAVAQDYLVDQDSTVSTLCLEALAYIPPPLVNEARYYSRRSRAAQWHNFSFDSGRYAFCAIDVSDYFDVNSVYADYARSSSPDARVSIAYMFENENHTGYSMQPSAWDTFMEQYRGDRSKVPLVSMADWNLALWNRKPAGWESPFCRYVQNNGQNFYGIGGNTGTDADKIRRMTFVSDSWFPDMEAAESGDEDYDLTDPQNQPFSKGDIENTSPSLMSLLQFAVGNAKPRERLKESICGLGYAALFDYLDPNRVPVSLAIPTCERVPMVCAIEPQLSGTKVTIEPTQDPDVYDPAQETPALMSRKVKRVKHFKLAGNDFSAGLRGARVVIAYPFRHKDEVNDSFSADGKMSLFFTSEAMGLRTGNVGDSLHFSRDPNISNGELYNGVASAPFSKQSLSFTTEIKDQADALKDISLTCNGMGQVASAINGSDFLAITFEWEQTRHKLENGMLSPWEPTDPDPKEHMTAAHCSLPPLRADGTPDSDIADDGRLLAFLRGGGTKTFTLNAAVWVRITHNDKWLGSKTVDMVPACMKDDDDLNGLNNYATLGPHGNQIGGTPGPVMRFNTGVSFEFGAEPTAPTTPEATISPQTVMVADPRFNHAPESWFQHAGGATAQEWLSNCHASDNDRDGDIFMFVSDQGYLQSIYELANLPRLTEFYIGTKYDRSGTHSSPANAWSDKVFPGSFGQTANRDLMWRTYDPFPGSYRADGDDFGGAGFTSFGNGFKVNPYSGSTNVMMAVFANTPHDWRVSSTNNQEQSFESMGAKEFNAKFAWNEYSSGAKLAWEDLEEFCGEVIETARSGGKWKNLGWHVRGSDASEQLVAGFRLSGNSDKIWNCDRKFLYGFWRDCFATRQQLFLVFARAEPTMMGGGAIGQTPPQLGARAMALVWRDPRATSQAGAPHQTRILFYRQFD